MNQDWRERQQFCNRLMVRQALQLFGAGVTYFHAFLSRVPLRVLFLEKLRIGELLYIQARHPADGVSMISLEYRHDARLKTHKTNNLVYQNDVAGRQTHIVKMLAVAGINDRRGTGQLTRVLRDLRQSVVTLPGGVRAGKRGQSRGVMVTEPLYAIDLGNGQCGTHPFIGAERVETILCDALGKEALSKLTGRVQPGLKG